MAVGEGRGRGPRGPPLRAVMLLAALLLAGIAAAAAATATAGDVGGGASGGAVDIPASLDKDGDGKFTTKDELALVAALHKSLDKDSDGSVSITEMVRRPENLRTCMRIAHMPRAHHGPPRGRNPFARDGTGSARTSSRRTRTAPTR